MKVGVIGMGWMGTFHARAYQGLPGVQLTAVGELDSARHQELESEFGVPVHGDAAAVLEAVDAVSICTPDDKHSGVTKMAFEAGLPVLLEKPMEVSSAAARDLLVARPDPSKLMVGHILRFDQRVIRARELLEDGEIGELWHVQIWRQTTRTLGATPAKRTSAVWFLGIHDADLLLSLVGRDVSTVSAVGRSLVSEHIDIAHTQLTFHSGLVGTMDEGWTLPGTRPSRALAGFRLVGEKGVIEVGLGHEDLQWSVVDEPSVHLDTYNWPSRRGTGPYSLKTELTAFIDAVRSGEVPPVTGEDGLAAVELVELIHTSIAEGRPVSPGNDSLLGR